jgi:peptidoglycan hydrolase-like protein with peptidoglycan-binding domain
MIDLDFTANFIAGFEGFVDHVYLDAVGVETVGYGETRRDVIELARLLRQGVDGDDVRHTQRRLGDFGWSLVHDGLFGPKTHAAVSGFQQGAGLAADGIVGPATWTALWPPPAS